MDSTTFPPVQPDPGGEPSRQPGLAGRVLGGGLRVLEQLGETSEGPLYRAESTMTGVEVTLVLLRGGAERDGSPPDPARLARALQQLRRPTELDDPNVAAVFGVDTTEDGLAYIVVEYLRGELLAQILGERRQTLPLSEAAHLILQAAAALERVHEAGLVHGNLSPATILVTRTAGNQPLVRLVAFAPAAASGREEIERALDEGDEVRVGYVSALYESPERLAGHPPDARGDIFSLGAVLHHLLTGAPPVPELTPAKPIPKPARPVLAKALAAWPAEPFETVAEFADALKGLAIERPPVRRLAPFIAASAIGGVAVALAALYLWLGSPRPRTGAAPGEAAVASDSAETGALGSAHSKTAPGPLGAGRVAAAAGLPIEGTWRLLSQRVGQDILRPPRAEGFFGVRDGTILFQLRRVVGDTVFEFYGNGGYTVSPDQFSYGYDRMVWLTRRPTGVTVHDTIPFEHRRAFRVRRTGAGVRYEADGGRYVLEVVGDTLNYGEAGAWVRRWIRVRPASSGQ